MAECSKIRNVAIIAHVDHGKTSLVDCLLKQSGLFRSNQQVGELLMDSMDQEKERGITITSKIASVQYKDTRVNIVDTPGHADFGGQVESILHMVDAAILVVHAVEGPMPQTKFVLKKAISQGLPILIVVNKIDMPDARCDWVLEQTLEMMSHLEQPGQETHFSIMYASAKEGYAVADLEDERKNIEPLYEAIVNELPAPKDYSDKKLKCGVGALLFDSFLGRLCVGKLEQGNLRLNQEVLLTDGEKSIKTKITKLYAYQGSELQAVDELHCGEIGALAGAESAVLGDTITDPEDPQIFEKQPVEPPTLSMQFLPNDSPFSGREGSFVTSSQIEERLAREVLVDAALIYKPLESRPGYQVSGRGELHLSVLIEKMRREGYEFQVSRPEVIFREEDGVKQEPIEEVTLIFPEEHMGEVMEVMGSRKASLVDMLQEAGEARLVYHAATRALIGMRPQYISITKGMGIIASIFLKYAKAIALEKLRIQGSLVSMSTGKTSAYALKNLEARGILFLKAGEEVYEGQIIGRNSKEGDLTVNPTKGKKLTNVRASGSDDSVVLTAPEQMSLERCLTYIENDELVEVTPVSIRLRKKFLKEVERRRS